MDYRLPLGISVGFCGEDFYKNLEEAKKNGFEYIDFDIASSWRNPEKEEKYYRDLEKGIAAVRDAGLKINAVHLSFGIRWDPAGRWPRKRKKIVDRLIEITASRQGRTLRRMARAQECQDRGSDGSERG